MGKKGRGEDKQRALAGAKAASPSAGGPPEPRLGSSELADLSGRLTAATTPEARAAALTAVADRAAALRRGGRAPLALEVAALGARATTRVAAEEALAALLTGDFARADAAVAAAPRAAQLIGPMVDAAMGGGAKLRRGRP